MKKATKLLSLVLAVLLVMSFAACASSSDGSSASTGGENSSEAGGDSSASEGGSDEAVTLTFSHFHLEDDRENSGEANAFLTMLEEFQEENPNITLELSAMYQADYATKIQAQATAGEMPDLFFVKGSWVTNFLKNNILLDLTEDLDAYEHKDSYREGIFDAASRDGKVYALPIQVAVTSVVYYNADLWSQAGYDSFPTTWEDIYSADKKFDEMGIYTVALGNKDKWPAESSILSALGDRYTGPEWTQSIIDNDGEAKFTDQEFVDALAALQDMTVLFNEDYNTITNNQADDYYCNGEAVTLIEGQWNVAYLQANATEEVLANTKVALIPAVDGGKGEAQSTSGGCGWYMGANSNLTDAKRDAAIKLLFKTCGYEYSEFFVENYGLDAPCIIDVDLSSFDQLTQDYMALTTQTSLTPIYDILMEGAVIDVMNSGIQDLFNGAMSPEDLAAAIQAEQDKVEK